MVEWLRLLRFLFVQFEEAEYCAAIDRVSGGCYEAIERGINCGAQARRVGGSSVWNEGAMATLERGGEDGGAGWSSPVGR